MGRLKVNKVSLARGPQCQVKVNTVNRDQTEEWRVGRLVTVILTRVKRKTETGHEKPQLKSPTPREQCACAHLLVAAVWVGKRRGSWRSLIGSAPLAPIQVVPTTAWHLAARGLPFCTDFSQAWPDSRLSVLYSLLFVIETRVFPDEPFHFPVVTISNLTLHLLWLNLIYWFFFLFWKTDFNWRESKGLTSIFILLFWTGRSVNVVNNIRRISLFVPIDSPHQTDTVF